MKIKKVIMNKGSLLVMGVAYSASMIWMGFNSQYLQGLSLVIIMSILYFLGLYALGLIGEYYGIQFTTAKGQIRR